MGGKTMADNYENQPGDESTVSPEEALMAWPQPGPVPNPVPLPPDWWRCLRRSPVSGRYQGIGTCAGSAYKLDMRVDIDPLGSNSPVMNRISGDIWQVYQRTRPGWPPRFMHTYLRSWIIDAPKVSWSRCSVGITGTLRFWKGGQKLTKVEIVIPWSNGAIGPAEVSFLGSGGIAPRYTCRRYSDTFRDMVLEIDVCQSVNQAPLVPSYDTHWHNTRPTDLPRRVLTIESAYREAGVNVSIRPDHTEIDDSASEFTSWSPAELHDAMETHFSQYSGRWPNWQMWGLMAGRFDNAGVGGIMFDAAAMYGGAGKAPERQGFAVFRNHQWFNNLVDGAPTTQAQAWAMRHFLYTWVHEAGHAFNFLHSWNKSRPDSLSWMNYDWRYDQRNGTGSYWSDFRFCFDDEELLHLRHGDRSAVIMGGDPWASGGHLEAPPEAMAQAEGDIPLEVRVRSNSYFEMFEPVLIEVRLRNLMSDMPVTIDKRLTPEYGGLTVYIRQPSGRIIQYAPIMCALGEAESWILKPQEGGVEGEDRFSREIFLTYGSDGFYFDTPGEYMIRAVYQGSGDMLIPSNTHRIRIGSPTSREEDRFAQEFFSDAVGLALYLGGSRSPWLEKGREVLQETTERFKGSLAGTKAASFLAQGLARDFFRVSGTDKPKLKLAEKAEPKRALELTEPALKLLGSEKSKALNLSYGRLVRRRAEYHQAVGSVKAAKGEFNRLCKDLADRGVNRSVLEWYDSLQKKL
jgi:hypothetical protein